MNRLWLKVVGGVALLSLVLIFGCVFWPAGPAPDRSQNPARLTIHDTSQSSPPRTNLTCNRPTTLLAK